MEGEGLRFLAIIPMLIGAGALLAIKLGERLISGVQAEEREHRPDLHRHDD
jgi:hypothetical protein